MTPPGSDRDDSPSVGDDDNMVECPAQAQVDVNARMSLAGNNTKQKITKKKENDNSQAKV